MPLAQSAKDARDTARVSALVAERAVAESKHKSRCENQR